MKLSTVLMAQHFRVLTIGGGAAGCGASSKFARLLGKNEVGIVEPNKVHYYQPGFTMVGGNLMKLKDVQRNEADLIHPKAKWIQDKVDEFKPQDNAVVLSNGDSLTYDFLIIATGCRLRFDKIKGMPAALETPGVCSNYLADYCEKTYREVMNFKSGNCVFTYPLGLIKCPGAPQKAAYITDSLLRQRGVRRNAHIYYTTSLPKIFAFDRYAGPLEEVAKSKDIEVWRKVNLIEVDPVRKLAIFDHLNETNTPTGKKSQIEYSLLHVSPPCTTVESLERCKHLVDANGWLDVDHATLQSKHYPNIFGAGDCVNTPQPKTAAAVSSQLGVVGKNLGALLQGRKIDAKYEGYASCPLVVSTNKVMLAEFSPQRELETTPFDQRKPSYFWFYGKKYLMPWIYWSLLVKGHWNGPAKLRKIFHLGMKK